MSHYSGSSFPTGYPGFPMTPPMFTTHTSDYPFVQNPNVDGNNWGGQHEAQDTTNDVLTHTPEKPRVVVQLPKEKEKDADVPTELQTMTKMVDPIPKKDKVVKNDGWRSDTSKMYTCNMCQYVTPDNKQIGKHFAGNHHKEVRRHLYRFLPKQVVNFVDDYLLFKKRKIFKEQKNSLQPPAMPDKFRGVGERQFFHRIQAAHCQACDVVIPNVMELMEEHIKSADHQQQCQDTFAKIKHYSPLAAAELFKNEDVSEMLEKYNTGQKPFTLSALSPHVSSTNKILVAEEDDEDDDDDDDDTNDEDGRDDPEVPFTLPDEPGTSSTTAQSWKRKCNSPEGARENFQDICEILKKYKMGQDPFKDITGRSPQVSSTEKVLVAEEYDDTNEDAIDDPKVPVTHNESPAHETKAATLFMTVNTGGTVKEEETEEEEEEMAAEAP